MITPAIFGIVVVLLFVFTNAIGVAAVGAIAVIVGRAINGGQKVLAEEHDDHRGVYSLDIPNDVIFTKRIDFVEAARRSPPPQKWWDEDFEGL